MRGYFWAKVTVAVLVLVVGFTLVSGQVGQAYAAPSHGGNHGGYHGGYNGGWYHGGRYYGGWNWGWFVPVYPVYQCPPGYYYNPYVYNPNMYPPYCQRIMP